jgi:hypothetical protein
MAITKACCNIQDHTLHTQTAWADQRTEIEIDWRLARGRCTYSRACRRLFGQSFMSSGMRPHSRQLPVDGQRHQCRLWATCLLPICGYLLTCTRTNASCAEQRFIDGFKIKIETHDASVIIIWQRLSEQPDARALLAFPSWTTGRIFSGHADI